MARSPGVIGYRTRGRATRRAIISAWIRCSTSAPPQRRAGRRDSGTSIKQLYLELGRLKACTWKTDLLRP